MGLKDQNWINEAFDNYRRAHAELDVLKGMKREGLAFFIDELEDVLLDLKQAVIDVNSTRAWLAMLELDVLRSEVAKFLKGH